MLRRNVPRVRHNRHRLHATPTLGRHVAEIGRPYNVAAKQHFTTRGARHIADQPRTDSSGRPASWIRSIASRCRALPRSRCERVGISPRSRRQVSDRLSVPPAREL
jgi:hypothetical protein